jgi:hypothetical protein
METKRIAMMAATGSAAFLIGFAAVGLVAMASDTVTLVSVETTRPELAVEPVKVEPQAAITPEPAPEAEVVNEWPTPEEAVRHIPDGSYVVNDRKLPRSFRDVSHFVFETSVYSESTSEGDPWIPIPPKGTIVIGKKTYKFTRIAVGATTIGFQTEERNGVSYKFTGKFNNFDYCETEEELPDVTGRLIKLEKNKWVAEAELSFSSPGCFCSQ